MHAQSAVATLVASVTGTAATAGGAVVVAGAVTIRGTVVVVAAGGTVVVVVAGGTVVVVAGASGGGGVAVVTTGRDCGMANPAMTDLDRCTRATCASVSATPGADAGWRPLRVKRPMVNPARTASAVVSAMRIRTAPPFVGRQGARLCSVWAGS